MDRIAGPLVWGCLAAYVASIAIRILRHIFEQPFGAAFAPEGPGAIVDGPLFYPIRRDIEQNNRLVGVPWRG